VAATVTETIALPLPLADDSEIHPALAPALHPQVDLEAVSVAATVAPAPAMLMLPGDNVNVQGGATAAAACVTAILVPATVIVAVRCAVVALSPAVIVTAPDPVPLALDVVAQTWSEAAAQVHDVPLALTTALKLSPPEGELCDAGVTVNVHGVTMTAALVIAASRPSMFAPGVLPPVPISR